MLCEHGNIAPCVECDVEPLRAENEALRERLENYEALKRMHRLDNYPNELSAKAWLLRKQAEAVEDFVQQMDSDGPWSYREDAMEYAVNLRQQADEIEND